MRARNHSGTSISSSTISFQRADHCPGLCFESDSFSSFDVFLEQEPTGYPCADSRPLFHVLQPGPINVAGIPRPRFSAALPAGAFLLHFLVL